MNFDLSEEQTLLRQTIREFAEREIAPGASARDEAARFPSDLIPRMADLGLFGINIPQEYGGAGLDALGATIIIEEVARFDGALALIVASHNSLCAGHILSFGSETQKQKYLPFLASGKKLGAWRSRSPVLARMPRPSKPALRSMQIIGFSMEKSSSSLRAPPRAST